MSTVGIEQYLNAAAQHCQVYVDQAPNFLMSPYWMRAQGYIVEVTNEEPGRWVYSVLDPETGERVLPSICAPGYSTAPGPYTAGFATRVMPDDMWDAQYVYTPGRILDGWKGSQFRGRRKALSLALRNLGAELADCQMVAWDRERDGASTQEYLANWADSKGDGIYDPELMVEAVLGQSRNLCPYSAGRASLLVKGRTMGIAVIDRGIPGWVNFRYCLVAPGVPGLSELCRMMTWQTIAQCYPDVRFINDGGCLNSPGLEQFKDKLFPVAKLFVPTRK